MPGSHSYKNGVRGTGEGKIEGREGGRWEVDKFFARSNSIPYCRVLEAIRGTDKALQTGSFLLIFSGDNAAVLSKVLNTSARCKISVGIWEICFQINWFLTSWSAGQWADLPEQGSQAGQGKPGWTQGWEDFGWVWHFQHLQLLAQLRMESFFCFDRGGLFSPQAGLLQVSNSCMCACWALKVFYKDLTNTSCDIVIFLLWQWGICQGFTQQTRKNSCFSILLLTGCH